MQTTATMKIVWFHMVPSKFLQSSFPFSRTSAPECLHLQGLCNGLRTSGATATGSVGKATGSVGSASPRAALRAFDANHHAKTKREEKHGKTKKNVEKHRKFPKRGFLFWKGSAGCVKRRSGRKKKTEQGQELKNFHTDNIKEEKN